VSSLSGRPRGPDLKADGGEVSGVPGEGFLEAEECLLDPVELD
jgi:hypothetical protein